MTSGPNHLGGGTKVRSLGKCTLGGEKKCKDTHSSFMKLDCKVGAERLLHAGCQKMKNLNNNCNTDLR